MRIKSIKKIQDHLESGYTVNETLFTKQVMDNWYRQRLDILWFHKIADPTFGPRKTQARAIDVVACFKGIFIGMEWKLIKNTRAFPINRIRDNQVKTLCNIEVAGGVGLIMIAVYLPSRIKYIYAVPIKKWNQAVRCATKKSIKLDDVFIKYRFDIKQVGKYKHWDMKIVESYINKKAKRLNEDY